MSAPMRRFYLAVALALAAAAPALSLRMTGTPTTPAVAALLAGLAILGAGFMLSWSVEAAEGYVSRGLALAVLALITVLPEFVVDFVYGFKGGQLPGSDYVHYAAANMTGANRLLVGLGWPLIVLLYAWRTRRLGVELARDNAIEVIYLAIASLYSFVLVAKARITAWDAVVLFAVYGLYLWRLSRLPRASTDDDDDDDDGEVGPAAVLETLPRRQRFTIMGVLGLLAGAIILLEAEPFAESLVDAATTLGINHFFLIQWVSPLAGELPELIIVVLFTLSLKPVHALGALVSDKINQWTLLLGALPLVYSLGAGHLAPLMLGARQREELFLTAAQSIFAVLLIARLKLTFRAACILLVLFLAQVAIAFVTQADEAATIRHLTLFSWCYVALSAVLGALNARTVLGHVRFALSSGHSR
ncbi:sodium:proton exchanger [Lysobacter xanthus]